MSAAAHAALIVEVCAASAAAQAELIAVSRVSVYALASTSA